MAATAHSLLQYPKGPQVGLHIRGLPEFVKILPLQQDHLVMAKQSPISCFEVGISMLLVPLHAIVLRSLQHLEYTSAVEAAGLLCVRQGKV